MPTTAHSPGFQEHEGSERQEQLLRLYQQMLWSVKFAETFTMNRGPYYAVRPHLEQARFLLEEIEALENGAPL